MVTMRSVAGGNVREWESYRRPIIGTPVGHEDGFHQRHPRGIRIGSKFITPTGTVTVVDCIVERFSVLMVMNDGRKISRLDLVQRVIHQGWEHTPPDGNLQESTGRAWTY